MTDIKNIKKVVILAPPARTESLVEQRFGKLFVVSYLGRHGKRRANAWLCYCECGNWSAVVGDNLRRGNSTNCGCVNDRRIGSLLRTHGLANKSPEYFIWKSIRGRCNNPKDTAFDNYGGRGIALCDRWNDFALFLEDVGPRPSPNHSLDRIDNDGNYEPSNCRWATKAEQNNNKRSNHAITFQGQTKNLQQWVKEHRISKHIYYRALLLGKTRADALAYAIERKGKHDPVNTYS